MKYLLVAAVTLAASPAFAQFFPPGGTPPCVPPTPEQCRENLLPSRVVVASYWNTTCGRLERERMASDVGATCNLIYQAAADEQRPLYTTMATVSVPRSTPRPGGFDPARDYLVDAVIRDGDDTGVKAVNATGHATAFAAIQGRFDAAASGGSVDSQVTDFYLHQRSMWNTNGDDVGSCEEFVFERYYDYSHYEDQLQRKSTTPRAAFDLGYPLLVNGVQSKTGYTVAELPTPAKPSPKNLFFTFAPIYPKVTGASPEPFPFDPALLETLKRGESWYTHSIGWHGEMNYWLAHHGDALLYALADKQRDFAKLLAERAAIYKRWVDFDHGVAMADDDCGRRALPPAARPPHPAEQFWNPGDYMRGRDLTEYYGHDAFAGILVDTPAAFAHLVPEGSSMYASKVIDYAQQSYAVRTALTLSPTDPLALERYRMLTEAPAPTDAAGTPPPAIDASCDVLLAADGLPARPSPTCSVYGNVTLYRCLDDVAEIVAARLREVDARIEEALLEVEPHGCLAMPEAWDPAHWSHYSPCDWNPEMFVAEVRGYFVREREKDYGLCRMATGGVWYDKPDHFIYNAMSAGEGGETDEEAIANVDRVARVNTLAPAMPDGSVVTLKDDYTHSTEDVLAYIKLLVDWATTVDFGRDHEGKTIAGHSKADTGSLGNTLYSVGYSYAASWNLDGLPLRFPSNDALMCEAQLHARGSASAHATVFGLAFDLTKLTASVDNVRNGASRTASYTLGVEILGVDVLVSEAALKSGSAVKSAGQGVTFRVAREKGHTVDGPAWTFVVAGVPVTVRSGVAGSVGFAFEAGTRVTGDCARTSLTGSIGPAASLSAFVSGGVNLALVEIGVQIDLTLFRVDLPLTLAIELRTYANPKKPGSSFNGRPSIIAQPKLELELATLAGRLRAYLRFPIGSPMYVNLFSWDGIVLARTTLFEPRWNYPLTRVATGLAALTVGSP
jgi:hypothetical protein